LEERKLFERIVPVSMAESDIHFPVTCKIKHQKMLVCINVAGEAFSQLIINSDPATRRIFHNGIDEDVERKVHVCQSGRMDIEIFYDYLHKVLIFIIEGWRQAKEIPDDAAVLRMDNCSVHLKLDDTLHTEDS
jgi:hypothetical protein